MSQCWKKKKDLSLIRANAENLVMLKGMDKRFNHKTELHADYEAVSPQPLILYPHKCMHALC